MRMLSRINRLERQHRIAPGDAAEREKEKSIGYIHLLLRFDPAPAGQLADLYREGDRLAEVGQFLTTEQCEEGERVAARLTASLRAAQIATNQTPDGAVIPFGYKPGPTVAEPQLCGGNGSQQ